MLPIVSEKLLPEGRLATFLDFSVRLLPYEWDLVGCDMGDGTVNHYYADMFPNDELVQSAAWN
jgi:hypothetical protein